MYAQHHYLPILHSTGRHLSPCLLRVRLTAYRGQLDARTCSTYIQSANAPARLTRHCGVGVPLPRHPPPTQGGDALEIHRHLGARFTQLEMVIRIPSVPGAGRPELRTYLAELGVAACLLLLDVPAQPTARLHVCHGTVHRMTCGVRQLSVHT
jgi:hypothetical protein